MPLSGWAISSAFGKPINFFNLVLIPDLIEKNRELGVMLKEVHEQYGYLLMTIIGLHAAAALFHHFVQKDDILKRMLPCISRCNKN